MVNISDLPLEIIAMIYEKIDVLDFINLATCSRHFYNSLIASYGKLYDSRKLLKKLYKAADKKKENQVYLDILLEKIIENDAHNVFSNVRICPFVINLCKKYKPKMIMKFFEFPLATFRSKETMFPSEETMFLLETRSDSIPRLSFQTQKHHRIQCWDIVEEEDHLKKL